ncbi:MAG: transporter [Clostridiales bacterium]|nr:MAG: transporter [Clostridiales bacterium]
MKRSTLLLTSTAALTATLITTVCFGNIRRTGQITQQAQTESAAPESAVPPEANPAVSEAGAEDPAADLQAAPETGGKAAAQPFPAENEPASQPSVAETVPAASVQPQETAPAEQETPVPETTRPEPSKPETSAPESDRSDAIKPESSVPETPPATSQPEQGSGNASFISQVVDLVNAERAKEGLAPLTVNRQAEAAALVRAKEIEQSFSHTRPDGRKFNTVLAEQNLLYRSAGENIAYGQKTPEQVVNGWMNSPGHRANIMHTAFTSIGVGHYQNSAGVHYWVQIFIG